MIGTLLVRGLAAGLAAGILAAGFGFAFGESRIDRAIAVEEAAAARAPHAADEAPPPVSRDGQRAGLFVAGGLYGLAVGGLFALGFAALRGRGGGRTDWSLAVWLAALLFVAAVLVPALKYPANPPGIGDPQTIGHRTALYLTLVAISLLGLLAAWRLVRQLPERIGPAARQAAGAGVFVGVVVGALLALPGVNEVPASYPADLLWSFRLTSLGTQLVLWASLGGLFGAACERWPLADRRAARETGDFAAVRAAVPDDR